MSLTRPSANTATDAALLELEGSVHESPESFEVIGGTIVRYVRRRAPSHFAARSIVAMELDQSSTSRDLAEDADAAFLRSKAEPPWGPCDGGQLRVADLFSGCGAMSLGLREACRALGMAFVPALACDINRHALRVYADNFGVPEQEPVDLSGISSVVEGASTPVEVALTKRVSGVDFVLAGPPCQGHSNLNNHTRRNDPKNGLYLKVARFAKLFAPRFIVIENVPAVVRDEGNVVPRTMHELQRLGYHVEVGTVDMSRIGVPQTRKRHILIAAQGAFGDRVPTVRRLVAAYSHRARSVGWAIGDLLDIQPEGLFDTASVMQDVTKRRVDYLFDNDVHELPDPERPDCHRTKEHTYSSVYGRMRWDAPGPTITGGFNTMGQGRFVHALRRRTLTPHEAARLQFIPDFFTFDGVPTRKALTELIGNAVPPKLSYVVGLELLR